MGGTMPTLKQILAAIGIAILLGIVTGVVGFLSSARLEVSFDKLKDFDPTSLKSYGALGTSVNVDLELSEPREFVAYWGENANGKTVIESGAISFSNFKLSSRIEGVIRVKIGEGIVRPKGNIEYKIVGYYNSSRIVFSHRGSISGVGVYILDVFQITGMEHEVYVGYVVSEDSKTEGQDETWVTQCPIVMIEQSDAAKSKLSLDSSSTPTEKKLEAVQKAYPVLRTECHEFKMPHST